MTLCLKKYESQILIPVNPMLLEKFSSRFPIFFSSHSLSLFNIINRELVVFCVYENPKLYNSGFSTVSVANTVSLSVANICRSASQHKAFQTQLLVSIKMFSCFYSTLQYILHFVCIISVSLLLLVMSKTFSVRQFSASIISTLVQFSFVLFSFFFQSTQMNTLYLRNICY